MREKGDLTVLPVFDGATPPAKAQTKATRSDRAAEARQKVLVAGHGAEATQVTAAAQGCIDSKLIAAVFAALTGAVENAFFATVGNVYWDYFGFLEEEVPKCYLRGPHF